VAYTALVDGLYKNGETEAAEVFLLCMISEGQELNVVNLQHSYRCTVQEW
jgi:pentatricopeptide repeat protein